MNTLSTAEYARLLARRECEEFKNTMSTDAYADLLWRRMRMFHAQLEGASSATLNALSRGQ